MAVVAANRLATASLLVQRSPIYCQAAVLLLVAALAGVSWEETAAVGGSAAVARCGSGGMRRAVYGVRGGSDTYEMGRICTGRHG